MDRMATITPPPSPTEQRSGESTSRKHYSFLNALDSITGLSTELSPDGSLVTTPQEAIKRLSTNLYALLGSTQNGKVFAEMPMPNYDNGNVDLSTAGSPVLPSGFEDNTSASTRAWEAGEIQHSLSAQSSRGDMGVARFQNSAPETVGPFLLSQSFHDMARPSSPPFVRSMSTDGNFDSNLSARRRCTDASESSITHQVGHRKRTTFDDQRYAMPSPVERSFPAAQNSKRRWPVVISLKDTSAKERKKRLGSLPATPTEAEQKSMLTLKEALVSSKTPLSPLHDESEDRKFTMECKQMFRNPSQCSFIGEPKLSQSRRPGKPASKTQSKSRVHKEISPTTIEPQILDGPWPQHTIKEESDSASDPDAQKSGAAARALSSNERKGPSPPSKLDAKQTRNSSARSGNSIRKDSSSSPDSSPSRVILSSRVYQQVVSGHKKNSSNDSSTTANTDTPAPHDAAVDEVFGRALHERAASSRRSTRVSEVRRRHMSMVKRNSDSSLSAHCLDSAQSETDPLPTAPIHHVHNDCASIDAQIHLQLAMKQRALPPTPPQARHRAKSNASGKSSRREPRLRRTSGRQGSLGFVPKVSERKIQPLTFSPIMTMVDSNPDSTHGFRAGAISPVSRSMNKKGLRVTVKDGISSLLVASEYSPSGSCHSRSSSDQSTGTEITVPSNTNSFTALSNAGLDATLLKPSIYSFQAQPNLDKTAVGDQEAELAARQAELLKELLRINTLYKELTRTKRESTLLGQAHPSFQDMLQQDRQASKVSTATAQSHRPRKSQEKNTLPMVAEVEPTSTSTSKDEPVKQARSSVVYDWKPKIERPVTNASVLEKIAEVKTKADAVKADVFGAHPGIQVYPTMRNSTASGNLKRYSVISSH